MPRGRCRRSNIHQNALDQRIAAFIAENIRIKIVKRLLDHRPGHRETRQHAAPPLRVQPPEHQKAVRGLKFASAQQKRLHFLIGHGFGDQRVDRARRQFELLASKQEAQHFRLAGFHQRVGDRGVQIETARDHGAMGRLARARRFDQERRGDPLRFEDHRFGDRRFVEDQRAQQHGRRFGDAADPFSDIQPLRLVHGAENLQQDIAGERTFVGGNARGGQDDEVAQFAHYDGPLLGDEIAYGRGFGDRRSAQRPGRRWRSRRSIAALGAFPSGCPLLVDQSDAAHARPRRKSTRRRNNRRFGPDHSRRVVNGRFPKKARRQPARPP